jgi:YbbR domain-containing protein
MIIEITVLALFIAAILFVVIINLNNKQKPYKNGNINRGGGQSISPDVEERDKNYDHKK